MIQNQSVKVLVVGVGGYGFFYLKTLFEEFPEGKIEVSGVVDPYPENSDYYQDIISRNIPVFSQNTCCFQG